MFESNKYFREYVKYSIYSDCLGNKRIKIDKNKIDDYFKNFIKYISNKNSIDIELIKLIESKIKIQIKKLNDKSLFIYDTKIQLLFEAAEIKNNKLIEMYKNVELLQKLNTKINNIIIICDLLKEQYTEIQLSKRKNNNLSKKIEKIIYEKYNEIMNLKIFEKDINKFGLTLIDINNYLLSKINKDKQYCFDFIQYVFTLKNDSYNKIKENFELRIKSEEELFNNKMKIKVNDITENYDRIIKNLILSDSLKITEIKNDSLESYNKLKIELEKKEKENIELKEIIKKKEKNNEKEKIEKLKKKKKKKKLIKK